ncbi:zinc finger protein 580-like [Symphalangus syndactylus]|uniref:zinc finger protein 580-like n=1 Tax=Symphalangus syndactylus TaxID=9590 RepID=UPI003007759B
MLSPQSMKPQPQAPHGREARAPSSSPGTSSGQPNPVRTNPLLSTQASVDHQALPKEEDVSTRICRLSQQPRALSFESTVGPGTSQDAPGSPLGSAIPPFHRGDSCSSGHTGPARLLLDASGHLPTSVLPCPSCPYPPAPSRHLSHHPHVFPLAVSPWMPSLTLQSSQASTEVPAPGSLSCQPTPHQMPTGNPGRHAEDMSWGVFAAVRCVMETASCRDGHCVATDPAPVSEPTGDARCCL